MLGIKRAIRFGTSAEHTVDGLGIPVENRGLLAAEEVSKLLQESRAGYLDYFDGYLGKSGIFAAYSAHGTLPILLRPNLSEDDGLFEGTHYVAASAPNVRIADASARQAISDSARSWYSGHSRATVAGVIAEKLFSNQGLS